MLRGQSKWPTFIVLSSFLLLTNLAAGCFITNCPPGGKRARPLPRPDDDTRQVALLNTIRQCSRCGPALQGRCFGPNVCCEEHMGCLIGSLESLNCIAESSHPTPCKNRAPACGNPNKLGQCAAQGVCCDQESCHVDANCRREQIGSTFDKSFSVDNFVNILRPDNEDGSMY